MQRLDDCFYLPRGKILNNQSSGRWKETPLHDDVIKLKYLPLWLLVCGGNSPVVGSGPDLRKHQNSPSLAFEQTAEQIIKTPVIWDAIVRIMTSL